MVTSRKAEVRATSKADHSPSAVVEALRQQLGEIGDAPRVYIAFSGGGDSLALLHAAAALADELPPLAAIHVHHGLQAQADAWVEHCREVCAALSVPLQVEYVHVDPTSVGVEAAARNARYRAFEQVLEPGAVLLAAHHLDDQVETFLLRALRGSGSRGLAGIPVQRPLGRARLLRPFLSLSRAELRRYLAAHDLRWVEDPSNFGVDADRNYLRNEILPKLQQRFAGARAGLAVAALQAREDSDLLDALAAMDMERCEQDGCLRVAAIASLNEPRRRNLLRYWIRQADLEPPGRARLARLDDLLDAGEDRLPVLEWSHGSVRRYRGLLYLLPPLPAPPSADTVLRWTATKPLALPLGMLELEAAQSGRGLAWEEGAVLEVRFRRGGERLRLAGAAHSRPLKKLLQERGMPPWERLYLPLLYVNGELAAVPGVGVTAGHTAAMDQVGFDLHWRRVVPSGRIC